MPEVVVPERAAVAAVAAVVAVADAGQTVVGGMAAPEPGFGVDRRMAGKGTAVGGLGVAPCTCLTRPRVYCFRSTACETRSGETHTLPLVGLGRGTPRSAARV